mgnify:CR=1 FL=1
MKKLLWGLLLLPISLCLLFFGYRQLSGKNSNEVGLGILTWVKDVRGQSVDWTTLGQTEQPPLDHAPWDSLLRRHVERSGGVDYAGFARERTQLDAYLRQLSSHPPGSNWSEAEQLAYWINAYNAFTIQLILDHQPLTSIKDISEGLPMINSPWDLKFFQIGGLDFDLNTIEHGVLRQGSREPRIHFAINCASFSCPSLRWEAYTARKLDRQLDDQAHRLINDPNKNHLSEEALELSKIFDWFPGDFTREQSLRAFLRQYSKVPIRAGASIGYLDYDWSLNGR